MTPIFRLVVPDSKSVLRESRLPGNSKHLGKHAGMIDDRLNDMDKDATCFSLSCEIHLSILFPGLVHG